MGQRVLLIEDEPNIIEAIRFILTRDGWRVDTHSEALFSVDISGRNLRRVPMNTAASDPAWSPLLP